MNAAWTQIAMRGGMSLSADQNQRLSRYLGLLLAANARMNLTRITDREAAELHHVGDALTLLPYLPAGRIHLGDVGSGGGVPGIPLAIMRPDAQVLLIESTAKKAAFLAETVAELRLTNVSIINRRAEDLGRSGEFRQSMDVVVARAVATLNWLAEWCLPLLKVGGRVLAMKGPRASDELYAAAHAIRVLGGGSPEVHPAPLSRAEKHVIVELIKLKPTPPKYPRPATTAKEPL